MESASTEVDQPSRKKAKVGVQREKEAVDKQKSSSSSAPRKSSKSEENQGKEMSDEDSEEGDDDEFWALDDDEDESNTQQLSVTQSIRAKYPDPVWKTRDYNKFGSIIFQLHEELIDFHNFMKPTATEAKQRKGVIERIEGIAKSIWPECEVDTFGSYRTGLYLPQSDLDIVIYKASTKQLRHSAIDILAHQFNKRKLVSYIEARPQARVPILKIQDKETGIYVDLCFDQPGGARTADWILEKTEKYGCYKPLVLFLKYFLMWRGEEASETYKGGIGSYLLQMMVISLLQLHPARFSAHWRTVDRDFCLGSWLLSFFEMYGKQFNYVNVGISCTDGGFYYNKEKRGRFDHTRPYLLSVEDPINPDNDIGKNSYGIMKIRKAFEFAYQQLISGPNDKYPSLLSRIVGVRKNDVHLINRVEAFQNKYGNFDEKTRSSSSSSSSQVDSSQTRRQEEEEQQEEEDQQQEDQTSSTQTKDTTTEREHEKSDKEEEKTPRPVKV